MTSRLFWAALVIIFMLPNMAFAHVGLEGTVDVRIISDGGREFVKYRAYPQCQEDGRYFYVQASKGERYSIQVTNTLGRRIGVVVAVDGRNIIDGKKSDLRRNERMYIIGPYGTNTFEGWRTAVDRTNRFYFTEQSDSYAEKVFADASAMGTIAIAVFREKTRDIVHLQGPSSVMKEAPTAEAAPGTSRGAHSAELAEKGKREQAGTGFGETTYSPTRSVNFEPERTAIDRIVMKYEWRSELCRKGIIQCGPRNRLWPGGQEFAPIPRDFRG